MDRRSFIAGATALLTAPLVAEAQQAGTVPRIGFLQGTLNENALALVGSRRSHQPP